MRILNSILLIIPVLLIVLSCSDEGPSFTDSTIIPEEGLEDVKIGIKGSKVKDKIGGNYFEFGTTAANDLWNYQMDYDGLGLAFNMEKSEEDADILDLEVVSITITAPYKGKTAEGIGIGSSRKEVENTYPDPTVFEFRNVYEYEGVSYTFDETDKVNKVYVFD